MKINIFKTNPDRDAPVDGGPPQSLVDVWPEVHGVGVEGGGDVVHHCYLNKFLRIVDGLDDCCYINLTSRWTKRRRRGAKKDFRKGGQGERGVGII